MKYFVITTKLFDTADDDYLVYNSGNITIDNDGYFWSSFEVFKKCLPQNITNHRFAFFTKHDAIRFAKRMIFNQNYKIKLIEV